jgi:hypothetical protein
VQFGATSAVTGGVAVGLAVAQSFTDAALSVAPDAAESLVTKVLVCAVFIGPEDVSLNAVGPGITVGVISAEVI